MVSMLKAVHNGNVGDWGYLQTPRAAAAVRARGCGNSCQHATGIYWLAGSAAAPVSAAVVAVAAAAVAALAMYFE